MLETLQFEYERFKKYSEELEAKCTHLENEYNKLLKKLSDNDYEKAFKLLVAELNNNKSE